MAKKKKRVAKKTTTRTVKKPEKTTASKKPAKRSGSTSVDALLKKFASERSTKLAQLESLRKKKQELEDKAAKLREQITKMAEEETTTQGELSQLDARRDGEVSQLLAQLGVQLRESAPQGPTTNDGNTHQPRVNTGRDRVTSLSKGRDDRN